MAGISGRKWNMRKKAKKNEVCEDIRITNINDLITKVYNQLNETIDLVDQISEENRALAESLSKRD